MMENMRSHVHIVNVNIKYLQFNCTHEEMHTFEMCRMNQ